jgi:hypothetical protein
MPPISRLTLAAAIALAILIAYNSYRIDAVIRRPFHVSHAAWFSVPSARFSPSCAGLRALTKRVGHELDQRRFTQWGTEGRLARHGLARTIQ